MTNYFDTINDANPMPQPATSNKTNTEIIRLIIKYPKIRRFLYPENWLIATKIIKAAKNSRMSELNKSPNIKNMVNVLEV